MLDGFYKIGENCGSFCSVAMYNPKTRELKSIVVRDYDYQDIYSGLAYKYAGLYGIDFLEKLYYMEIDKNAKFLYNLHNDIVSVGMKIEVVKGRKYPKGTTGTVTKKYDYNDKYGRYITTYCITDNGMKIDTKNVKIIIDK